MPLLEVDWVAAAKGLLDPVELPEGTQYYPAAAIGDRILVQHVRLVTPPLPVQVLQTAHGPYIQYGQRPMREVYIGGLMGPRADVEEVLRVLGDVMAAEGLTLTLLSGTVVDQRTGMTVTLPGGKIVAPRAVLESFSSTVLSGGWMVVERLKFLATELYREE